MIKSFLGSPIGRAVFVAAALSANVLAFSSAQAAPAACRARAIAYCAPDFTPGSPEYAACVYEQVLVECPVVVPEFGAGPFCSWVGDARERLTLVCYTG